MKSKAVKKIFAVCLTTLLKDIIQMIKMFKDGEMYMAGELLLAVMRMRGLEPLRLAAQEPKSCMSANSITSAKCKIII